MLEKQHQFLYHERQEGERPSNWYATWEMLDLALFDLRVLHSFGQFDKVNNDPTSEYINLWPNREPRLLKREDFESQEKFEAAQLREDEEHHHHDLRFKNVFKLEQEKKDCVSGSFCLQDRRSIGWITDGEPTGHEVLGNITVLRVSKPSLSLIWLDEYEINNRKRKNPELSLEIRITAPEFDEFVQRLKEFTEPQCVARIWLLAFQDEAQSDYSEYHHPQRFFIGESKTAQAVCNSITVLPADVYASTVHERFQNNMPVDLSDDEDNPEQPEPVRAMPPLQQQPVQQPVKQIKTWPVVIALWAVAIALLLNAG